jgi:general stress protein YciG
LWIRKFAGVTDPVGGPAVRARLPQDDKRLRRRETRFDGRKAGARRRGAALPAPGRPHTRQVLKTPGTDRGCAIQLWTIQRLPNKPFRKSDKVPFFRILFIGTSPITGCYSCHYRQSQEDAMADDRGGSGNFANDPKRAAEAGHKGGQQSGGNFANDPKRAAEAGHKGGQQSGGNDREKASQAGQKGGQHGHGGRS